MKNIMKKVIAVFAVLCVATTTLASCSDDKKEDSGSGSDKAVSDLQGNTLSQDEIDALMKQPLHIGEANDGNSFASDGAANLDADDPTEETTTKKAETTKAVIAPTTAIQTITDNKGEAVTTVVEVTDANGEVQTDADNKPVTEAVHVTEVVTQATEEEKQDTTEAETKSDYKAKRDGRYAMWLDVSKDENFVFNGDMLEVNFKVKEGIPDGDYKITISPDLSDIAGVSVNPGKVIEGTIRVNNGTIEPTDVSGESGLTFYGDNVACKQGDSITFKINVKNNPGLAAFCIWFYFDSNALDFVDASACGEFEDIAKQTEIGEGGDAND